MAPGTQALHKDVEYTEIPHSAYLNISLCSPLPHGVSHRHSETKSLGLMIQTAAAQLEPWPWNHTTQASQSPCSCIHVCKWLHLELEKEIKCRDLEEPRRTEAFPRALQINFKQHQ